VEQVNEFCIQGSINSSRYHDRDYFLFDVLSTPQEQGDISRFSQASRESPEEA
jgi:hypothetical protein